MKHKAMGISELSETPLEVSPLTNIILTLAKPISTTKGEEVPNFPVKTWRLEIRKNSCLFQNKNHPPLSASSSRCPHQEVKGGFSTGKESGEREVRLGFRGVEGPPVEHFNLASPLQAPTRRGAASLHGSAHPVHVCLCVYWGTGGKTQKARSQLWKHRGASGGGGRVRPLPTMALLR